jgi:hypothetical protein
MKSLYPIRVSLMASALVFSVCPGFGQTPAAKAPAPAQGQDQPAKAQGTSLSLPVSGLTKENLSKVESAMAALSKEFYSCAACHVEHAKKGKCPGCGAEMTPHKQALLQESKAAPDKGMVSMRTSPGCEILLSQLDTAMKPAAVKVDGTKMTLTGKSTLLFANVATQEEAVALGKALTTTGLFQSVLPRFDAATKMARVEVSAGATAPTRAAVDAALEKAGSKLRIADVAWGTPASTART